MSGFDGADFRRNLIESDRILAAMRLSIRQHGRVVTGTRQVIDQSRLILRMPLSGECWPPPFRAE